MPALGPKSDGNCRDRTSRPRTCALHVFALASLATAPLLIVADAQFFIGRGASGWDVLAITLIVVLAAPALLALADLLITAAGGRSGTVFHLLLIALLFAVIVSQALYPLDWAIELQVPIVLAIGAAAAIAYARADWARSLVTALAPIPLILLCFVLFISPVSSLVFASGEQVEAPETDRRTPVVVVIFDELPGYALMDSGGRIDAARFPGFAAFARDAVWYRNATSSRSDTELAVPTLLTGRSAPLDSLPTFADHPRSLFTLLGSSHRMHVSEPWTNLCPERLCAGGTGSTDEGDLGSILATFPALLGHVAVPDAERIGIPNPRESSAANREQQVMTYIEELEPAERPVLHLLHVLLPHKAWHYLRSGERYSDRIGVAEQLGGFERWGDDPWPVLQYQQRFLLQLRFTDRLLGKLLDRLREIGLYDRSLIIVAADHGTSFRAADARRDATETNAPDILSVPLMVKLPGHDEGRIDDRPARTIDVVPTIADVLELEVPWVLEGRSLLGELPPDRRLATENISGEGVELTPAQFERERDAALRRQIASFGEGGTGLYSIGPHPKLRGRKLEQLPGEPFPAEASIVDGAALYDYDPATGPVASRIAGSVDDLEAHRPLAVSLNGRIAATTFSYEGERGIEFSAMVPPRLLRAGDNSLAVLAIERPANGGIELRPLELSS